MGLISISSVSDPNAREYSKVMSRFWVQIIIKKLPNHSLFQRAFLQSYSSRARGRHLPRVICNTEWRGFRSFKKAWLTSREKLERKHLFVALINVRIWPSLNSRLPWPVGLVPTKRSSLACCLPEAMVHGIGRCWRWRASRRHFGRWWPAATADLQTD